MGLPSKRERESTYLQQLEIRRGELAVAGWQAPALTLAAQAFLLTVLTNRDIPAYARLVILVAGVVATIAAGIGLLRLRAREEQYSEAIAVHSARLGVPDPRPFDLPRAKPASGILKAAGSRWWPPIHYSWAVALMLFASADIVAFISTRSSDPACPERLHALCRLL